MQQDNILLWCLSPHLQGQTKAPAFRKYGEDKRCVQSEGFKHVCCDCLGLMAVSLGNDVGWQQKFEPLKTATQKGISLHLFEMSP